jgi:hypothetical protein
VTDKNKRLKAKVQKCRDQRASPSKETTAPKYRGKHRADTGPSEVRFTLSRMGRRTPRPITLATTPWREDKEESA